MAGKAGYSNATDGSTISILTLCFIFLAVLFAMMAIIWIFAHETISYYVVVWKAYELSVFQWVPGVKDLIQWMVNTAGDLNETTFGQLIWAIYPGSLIFATPVILYAARCAFMARTHPALQMKKAYNHKSLMEAHARNFSSIYPIIDLDLLNSTDPRWSTSTDPGDFAKQHNLIYTRKREDGVSIRCLDRLLTQKAFENQLGAKHEWNTAKWSSLEKTIFALTCEAAFNIGDKNDRGKTAPGWANAEKLKDQLNYSARNSKTMPNLSLSQDLYEKWAGQIRTHEGLNLLMNRHSRIRVLLFALWTETTDQATISWTNRGVFPTSEIIWLRPNDRILYYVLNTVGRKTPFAESAGVFAQYAAEVAAGKNDKRLLVEYVTKAVDALALDLYETGLIDTLDEI